MLFFDQNSERKRYEMVQRSVNVKELGQMVKRRRKELGMSLRELAKVTGISPSTLSRIENNTGKPDADNIARLASWLGIPVDRILHSETEVKPVIYYPDESVPEIVEAHLRADKNLTPETAKALAELFRVAYYQFSKKSKFL
jgi:transcriptional regulator with XRE-family HTH domain